jgi:basic amino acid/polyamine antiporter, APA family
MSTLVRTLRLRDLLLLFVGTVIGSGIFLTPGVILQQVGGSVGVSLLVWLFGGFLSLLGALTYAELAAANPEAGGLYCYIRDGFGRLPAFLYGWSLFLVIASGAVAALTRAFTRYLAELIPLSSKGATIIGVLMIGVLTAANVWGTRKSSDVQNWTTFVKLTIVAALSAALLLWGRHFGDLRPALGPTQHGASLFSNSGLAMITVLWVYEGWQFATCSAGEVVDPQKSFPRAFLAGSVILIGFYLIAVVSYLVALGPAAAQSSGAIAASSAREVLGPWAGRLISLTVLIATFSAANGTILTTPRVFYAMAHDGLFFRKLAEIHPRFHTPAVAVVTLGVWSAVLACVGSFVQLISGVIFIAWIFHGLAAASIFPMRRKNSIEKLPYCVPGYPWTPFLFVLAAAALVLNAIYLALYSPDGFIHITIAILIFGLGVPMYFFWRRKSP